MAEPENTAGISRTQSVSSIVFLDCLINILGPKRLLRVTFSGISAKHVN